MKKYWIFGIVLLGVNVTSCDFLEREPLDFGDEGAYFKNQNDLAMSVNEFYSMLPKMDAMVGGVAWADNSSDNQMGNGVNNAFYPGDKKTVSQNNSEWKFVNLRGINFFINKTEELIEAGTIVGTEEYINHYLGEGYFFRGYDNFRLLRNFGDVPLLTTMQPDDADVLRESTKRAPRNEVVRSILNDLDKAALLMMKDAPESGRLCKYAAFLMKARVALYEATWEKYHAGTCFVPGNPKWPGAASHPDFQFKSGSAEAEVNFFFEEAIAAADSVIRARPQLDKDYISMFNSTEPFKNTDEVILPRYYADNVLTHSVAYFLGGSGGATGYTRALVNSFLMKSGLPIYVDENYQGDKMIHDELEGRDPRLVASMKDGGVVVRPDTTIVYGIPQLQLSGNETPTTGYQVYKHVSKEAGQNAQSKGTSATPIFRAAEAYLTYLEAFYERYGKLDGTCDDCWRALRTRAGVDPNYQTTIDATDLSQENDLATKWKGQYIDKTLYNIRRERRCEFIAEGMRLDDLKRWRALDNMVNYQVEGMNLWEYMYQFYKADNISEGTVSQAGVSNYIRPLQKSASGSAYFGYNFPKPHYLEPIPITEFTLATDPLTGKSVLYQNPGWPSDIDGLADYTYDCD